MTVQCACDSNIRVLYTPSHWCYGPEPDTDQRHLGLPDPQHFGMPDPQHFGMLDPHHFGNAGSASFWDDGFRFAQREKWDHNSDPHQSRKPDPDPNPRQIEKQVAAALTGAMRLSLEPRRLIMEP